MLVTYTPEDGDRQTWEFNPGRVRQSETEIIEKRYGKTYEAFKEGVTSGDSRARRVLLWHLLRRDHHTLRFEDTPDFFMDELVVEYSRDEMLDLRDRIVKANLPEDERTDILAALDLELGDVVDGEGKAVAPSGA